MKSTLVWLSHCSFNLSACSSGLVPVGLRPGFWLLMSLKTRQRLAADAANAAAARAFQNSLPAGYLYSRYQARWSVTHSGNPVTLSSRTVSGHDVAGRAGFSLHHQVARVETPIGLSTQRTLSPAQSLKLFSFFYSSSAKKLCSSYRERLSYFYGSRNLFNVVKDGAGALRVSTSRCQSKVVMARRHTESVLRFGRVPSLSVATAASGTATFSAVFFG
jgi:hypothetical protein